MSNFPRFGRARNRPSVVARPTSAAGRLPAAELKPEILPLVPVPATTQILEPYLEPNTAVPVPAAASPLIDSTRRLPSPVKKVPSRSASPIFEALRGPPPVKKTTSPSASPKLVVLPGPPPVKVARSPPDSPENIYSRRMSPPRPLSPLALPRTQVTAVSGTTTHPRIEAEVEQKKVVYNKTVEKPAKSDRTSEYGSGKPPQQPEAINLTGHNVGAVMEVNHSSAAGQGLGGETTKSNQTEGGKDDKKAKGKKKKSPMTTFMNANFQSVNNSVLYDSSCNHRDPGLHLAFSDKEDGDGAAVDGRKNYKP